MGECGRTNQSTVGSRPRRQKVWVERKGISDKKRPGCFEKIASCSVIQAPHLSLSSPCDYRAAVCTFAGNGF